MTCQGGDILIHSGDISSMGTESEVRAFCQWYDNIPNYEHKIWGPGNHDFLFQDNPTTAKTVISEYPTIDYIQDSMYIAADETDYQGVNIWGHPWMPKFRGWAFNITPNSKLMNELCDQIPTNTDILVSHTPAFGILDTTEHQRDMHIGCETLAKRIEIVQPKIHVCGHIHSGYGYQFNGTTHFFNASVLGESYTYQHLPITFDWDKDTNEIEFINIGVINGNK